MNHNVNLTHILCCCGGKGIGLGICHAPGISGISGPGAVGHYPYCKISCLVKGQSKGNGVALGNALIYGVTDISISCFIGNNNGGRILFLFLFFLTGRSCRNGQIGNGGYHTGLIGGSITTFATGTILPVNLYIGTIVGQGYGNVLGKSACHTVSINVMSVAPGAILQHPYSPGFGIQTCYGNGKGNLGAGSKFLFNDIGQIAGVVFVGNGNHATFRNFFFVSGNGQVGNGGYYTGLIGCGITTFVTGTILPVNLYIGTIVGYGYGNGLGGRSGYALYKETMCATPIAVL